MINALNKPTNYFEFIGTSGEDKPTEGIGALSLFHEVDTGDDYWFDGDETWAKVGGSTAETEPAEEET